MGLKKIPGLFKKREIWHIDKVFDGKRICLTTGTRSLKEAEQILALKIEEMRKANIFGVRPKRTFNTAIIKYAEYKQDKKSIADDMLHLKQLAPFIGELLIEDIHNETLKPFIEFRKKQNIKTKSINNALGVVRHLLNLAEKHWIDEYGLYWLDKAPFIQLLVVKDARPPCPISFDEQDRLVSFLPNHLKQMILYKVNTGCREQEVVQLSWDMEHEIIGTDKSIFILPAWLTKNGIARVVVLNREAQAVIESVRDQHEDFVFTYHGKPVTKINNSGWKTARGKAELRHVRVHDIKHTFGKRLRAAKVSFEDRQDLLGHKTKNITEHYSAAELQNLIDAANMICADEHGLRKCPEAVAIRKKRAN